MIVLTGVPQSESFQKDLEHLVNRVFFKAIDLLGGLQKLAEYRTLTWLPSLARAAFAVILREEYMKTEDEIAQMVGLTRNTVRNILRADPTLVMEKLKKLEELAKEEAKEMKVQGQEAETLMHYCGLIIEDTMKHLDIPWAYTVLKHLKGTKYPITGPEVLKEKLKDVRIKTLPATEVVEKLHYPIKNPAQLLHEINMVISTEEGK